MPKTPLPNLEEVEVKNSVNSQQDNETIAYVLGRFKDMQFARNVEDKNWTLYQKQMEAIWQPYPDGRSSFAIPLTRALVERGIAEEIRIPLTRVIRAEKEEYRAKATAYEEVRNYVGRTNNIDWELLKNAYTCWLYGTSILHTHFERSITEQSEPNFTSLNDVTYDSKYIVQNKILVEDFNINNFYPDNRVIDYDDAVDTIAMQVIPFEAFAEYENQAVYKNVDRVQPVAYMLNAMTNLSEEERSKTGKFVHIMHYWNLSKDMYVAVANNSVVIRQHPIWSTKKGAKCIPFSMRRLGYKQRSLWGVGMGYYGQQSQSNLNDVSEMIFD